MSRNGISENESTSCFITRYEFGLVQLKFYRDLLHLRIIQTGETQYITVNHIPCSTKTLTRQF